MERNSCETNTSKHFSVEAEENHGNLSEKILVLERDLNPKRHAQEIRLAGRSPATYHGMALSRLRPTRGPGRRRIIEVSRPHTTTHTIRHKPVELLETGHQFVAEAANYTTHNKHERRTSVLSAGLKPAIPAMEKPQTYASERTTTGLDPSTF
jgi:hypothetical protein